MKFEEIRKKAISEWQALEKSDKPRILIGAGTCGKAAGAEAVVEAIQRELKARKIDSIVTEVGCIGLCYLEPLVDIIKPGAPRISYSRIDPDTAVELIEDYLVNDNPRPDIALGVFENESYREITRFYDHPMLKPQVRIVLRNCGHIDPTKIDHYIARDGYVGLSKALEKKPEEVIEEIRVSGLRGRGGGGFPTYKKWEICRSQTGPAGESPVQRYLICNADEGDPGAFMNRSLLEGDPHSVLEGMLIAGYAIGASQGYVYIRAEYPLAIERLRIALTQMRDYGLLGKNILNSGFDFDIKIKEGAGAFVCGEETALIASLEGKRGMPHSRPPYPAVSGFRGKPTIINNVETMGTVASILRNGGEWYSEYGTEGSKGTKTFALAGKIYHTGLIEVPMGITLREIVYEIGGGIVGGKQFKAVQTGGPSGGCLSSEFLDLPVDYESLTGAGSIMGSGGMIVMDENTCLIDIAHYFVGFTQAESCGKCVPCRVGTGQMLKILERIRDGQGETEDIERLVSLGNTIKMGALCGLGQTAPNPVLTTLKYFGNEYEEHIKYKICKAGVCKGIISSACQHVCPLGQDVPSYVAYIAKGQFDEASDLIRKENPLPGVCGRVCHHPCEGKCKSGEGGEPVAIRALKRFVTDYALQKGIKREKIRKPIYDEKIAVIGSGPAGLVAAYYLVEQGYRVTILEALPVAGGMLAVGIPEYRLPKRILDIEIENIKKAGVEIKTNMCVGKDISLTELRKEYDAVFVGTGAHKGMNMGIPGEETEGVIDAITFLRDVSLGKEVKLGRSVAVIGGGNAAIDASRTALRLGCEEVQIIYRRTRNEMPAFAEEIEAAIEEGVGIEFLSAPVKVLSNDGKLGSVECIRMELGKYDKSGRRRPVPVEGSEFNVVVDTMIYAIRQEPDTLFLKGSGIKTSNRNTVVVDPETRVTSEPGVFAGGDVVTGPDTVTEAMGAGKIAAQSIHKYLRGESLARKYEVTRPSVRVKPPEFTDEQMEEILELKRPKVPELPVKERKKGFKEVALGLSEEAAVNEAKRCLRCDLEVETE